jgi:DNA-binding NarL/FixJ family response regulator
MRHLEEVGVLEARSVPHNHEVEHSLAGDRLVLVEAQTLLRESFAHLLANCLPGTPVEAFGRVEDIRPGPARLVLIGTDLGRSSIAAFAALFRAARRTCEEAPIGVLLHRRDAIQMRDLCALGVVGIIQDEASIEIAIAAIRLMIVGGYSLPREAFGTSDLATREAQELPPPARQIPTKIADSDCSLTSRERDVLKFLREGRQNKVIAFELGISESTVKVHVCNIMKKLRVSNRTQVAVGAVQLD